MELALGAGARAAPDRTARLNGSALTRLASSYVGVTPDRDDLLQDISVAIWRALPAFEASAPSAPSSSASRTTARSLTSRDDNPIQDAEDANAMEDSRPNPEETLSAEQQGRRLLDTIQQLPLNHRQVVTLTLEGLSYSEIADVLGISETNVGARLTRARQMLRARL